MVDVLAPAGPPSVISSGSAKTCIAHSVPMTMQKTSTGLSIGSFDLPEDLPIVGAVDPRRVDQFPGHALQRRQEDHGVEPDIGPDLHQGDGGHGPELAGQPGDRRHAELAQRVIDDPGVRRPASIAR